MYLTRIKFLFVIALVLLSSSAALSQEILLIKGNHQCKARTLHEKVFIDSVRNNDIVAVERFLRQGSNPNSTDDCGVPVITYASALVSPDLVKLLITARADVNVIDDFNNKPPLSWALDSADKEKESEVVAVVKLFVSAKVNVNKRGKYDEPALTIAVEKGLEQVVKVLIESNADINAKDGADLTAYSYAAQIGNRKLKSMLIAAGADITIGVNEYKNMYGENALFQAAADSRTDVVEAMLASGTNVNMVNGSKMTALMRAVADSTFEALLAAGADVNMKDDAGYTALIWAVLFGRTSHVAMLIAAGADVNATGPEGQTALELARNPETKKILIDAGAKPN